MLEKIILAIMKGAKFIIGPIFDMWKKPSEVKQVGGGTELGDKVDDQMLEDLKRQRKEVADSSDDPSSA